MDLPVGECLAHGRGVGEGAQLDLVVLQLEVALVVGVLGEDGADQSAALDLGLHRVGAGAVHGEALAELLGVVVLLADDAGGGGGELEGEGRVRGLQVEDDGVGALDLDVVEGGEERGGAVLVLDGEDAVDGELDVLGGEGLTVGELQTGAQGAAVALVAGVGEAAGGGRFGDGLAAAARGVHQRLDGLAQDVPGAGVVGVGRVEGGGSEVCGLEPIGGSDDDRSGSCSSAARAAAGGQRGGEQSGRGRQHHGLAVHAGSTPCNRHLFKAA